MEFSEVRPDCPGLSLLTPGACSQYAVRGEHLSQGKSGQPFAKKVAGMLEAGMIAVCSDRGGLSNI